MRQSSLWFYAGLQLLLVGAASRVQAQAAPAASATGQGAEVKAEAQNKAREARKLADKGQHEKALDLFRQAYETYQEPGYLYNMGIEYQALGREPEAFDTFERFLKDVEKIPPEFVADANQQQRELRKRLAELEVKSTQEGAHVFVDDRDAAQTPLDTPIRVRVGSHKVSVRKDGFEPYQTTVNVTGGGKTRIEALMRPIPVGGSTLASTPAAMPGAKSTLAGTNATDPALTSTLGRGSRFGAEEPLPTSGPASGQARRPFHLSASVGADIWASGVPGNPQPSAAFTLGAGYRLATLSPGAEFRLGGKLGLTFLSEPAHSDVFVSVLANPMITLTIVPNKLFAFGELGFGLMVVSGVQKDSVLLQPGSGNVSGALATFQLRPALGIAYALSPAFSLYGSPGLAWSPSPTGFEQKSLMQVELALGAMVQL